MPNKLLPHPIYCDIFCVVVDNYGDAGVCWRLARQLAEEYDWQVRLWIDKPTLLDWLAPDHAQSPVTIVPWPDDLSPDESIDSPADVVIEAFACELPATYVAAMAQREKKPVWLNLEYLSAENWIGELHGKPSPHPRLPLVKHFFFPGFDECSGGLLRGFALEFLQLFGPHLTRKLVERAAAAPDSATVGELFRRIALPVR